MVFSYLILAKMDKNLPTNSKSMFLTFLSSSVFMITTYKMHSVHFCLGRTCMYTLYWQISTEFERNVCFELVGELVTV